MADTQTSRSFRSLGDLPALYAQMTETPEFQRAFGDPIPLSIIEPGDAPGEHDMPDPLAVQAECGAIVATIFDLFADMRLAPLATEVAWGIVNSFHFTAQKLERREQALADELGDLARCPDLSEVYNNELEEKQLLCQSVAEHREAMEVCRDYCAEMYRAQSGWPWSPARGSRASKASTATQVAIRDYLRLREMEERERYLPRGPLVVASGHTGDGGIDGQVVIHGSVWLIQAKRYAGAIRPAHLQAFASLCAARGSRGLFIHTGRTGASSRDIVALQDPIEIVSGRQLLALITGGAMMIGGRGL